MSTTNLIADSLEKSGIPFVRIEGVADGTEYWGLTVFHENVHAEVRECADWVETKVWNCTPEQFMNMLVGAGTCRYIPDDAGFTWWDENEVEHYEEHSASDECCFASCDKCGNQMMVGEEGWFNGWDEITDWWEEDGSYHKGYVLEPRFKYCPNCGKRIEEEE